MKVLETAITQINILKENVVMSHTIYNDLESALRILVPLNDKLDASIELEYKLDDELEYWLGNRKMIMRLLKGEEDK
jgi:hypothetical protein